MDSREKKIKLRQKNEELNKWERLYRKEFLKSRPVHAQIPTGTKCNIRCSFCYEPEKAENVSFELFEKKFSKALKFASSVDLYGWGDPFVNPDYKNIFNYTTTQFPGIRICISTNGILLTKEWVERVSAYPWMDINISLNAACTNTYHLLTKTKHFKRIVENIRYLTKTKKDNQMDDMMVSLSFVAVKENIKELPDFIELAAELDVNHVLISDMMILDKEHEEMSLLNNGELANSIFEKTEKIAKEKGLLLDSFMIHSTGNFARNDQENPLAETFFDKNDISRIDKLLSLSSSNIDCFDPWERVMFADNGDIFTCCRSNDIMGNIFKNSLQEIWNGPAYRHYRSTINTDSPPDECKRCPRKTGYE